MKELSIEEKAKRYDEAKLRMSTAYNSNRCTIGFMNEIFPELAESEDERIRKAIINVFSSHADYEIFFGVSVKDILSWLEKQQKPIKEHDACEFCEDRYGCINPCPTKLIEKEKPADKVEPKFEIEKSKWYVCTQTFTLRGKIVVIKGQTYQSNQDGAIEGEDRHLFIDKVDGKVRNYFKPWAIQDAKDGDVLVASDGSIFIFKDTIDGACKHYVALTTDNVVKFNEGLEHYWETSRAVRPATKEQRDLLFSKMKEAGYEWDAEKKELKKIEKKSTEWTAEDEHMFNTISNSLNREKVERVWHTTEKEVDNWLKSLKDRYTWKPSDEQMKALGIAIRCGIQLGTWEEDALKSLAEQLKKLRKE